MTQHLPTCGAPHPTTVMPASLAEPCFAWTAGIHTSVDRYSILPLGEPENFNRPEWIPAFAGMTDRRGGSRGILRLDIEVAP